MRALLAFTVLLALLAPAAPAHAQVASASGDGYGCAYDTYWLEDAPAYSVSVYECGGATCVWAREEGTYVTFAQCAPGDPGVEGDAACHDAAAWAWRDGGPTFARERRCHSAATTDGGACLVRTSAVDDGRPAYVAHECVDVASGTKACRSETYVWDYGGTWHDRRCAGVEVRDEPCPRDPGHAFYLVVDDVTGWHQPTEVRLGCVAP